ncbi:unnamed protein product [Ectocarpus sp. CCAP 1310/34]|nr:unnamed protein product [Ectocarpus sp. CCAP 1310/34]
MVPFYVVEHSLRSCLCVHCYRAKLITVAPCQLWSTLSQNVASCSSGGGGDAVARRLCSPPQRLHCCHRSITEVGLHCCEIGRPERALEREM